MIRIDEANPSHASIITNVARQSFLESHSHSAPPADIEYYVQLKLTESVITDELTESANLFHVIYFDEKPVGFSKIVLNSSIVEVTEPNVTKLERIYLLEEYHGHRLGLKLLENCAAISRDTKQVGMWLYTWIENDRAIRFYQRFGFEIIGQADFKLSENHSNPNHLMYLSF